MSRMRKRQRLGIGLPGFAGLPAAGPGRIGPARHTSRSRGGAGRLGRALRSSAKSEPGNAPPTAKRTKAKSGKQKVGPPPVSGGVRSSPAAAKRAMGRSKGSAGAAGQRPAKKSGSRAKGAVRSTGKPRSSKK